MNRIFAIIVIKTMKVILVYSLANTILCVQLFSQNNTVMKAKFDTLFASYFQNDQPGGAVLIVKDGTVIYKNGFGVADVVTKERITTKTLFNIGSISKTFVSYGILKLASENRLSLNDPISKYFKDFKDPVIAANVSLLHLMTHTSGLPDLRKVKEQHEFYLTAKDEENWNPIKEVTKLEFEPGTRYKYSNPAFNALALVIEKITGGKWQDYIAKIIFQPAQMLTSTITDGPHPEVGVSHGYIENKIKGFDELDYGEEPTFAAAGNGGVWSSVEELWNYEKAIQSMKFLEKKWMDLSRIIAPFPVWKDKQPSRLGLSWFIIKDNNMDMIGHTGSQGGFISDYCWYPDEKIFYVLLCNVPKPLKEIRDKVVKTLLAGN